MRRARTSLLRLLARRSRCKDPGCEDGRSAPGGRRSSSPGRAPHRAWRTGCRARRLRRAPRTARRSPQSAAGHRVPARPRTSSRDRVHRWHRPPWEDGPRSAYTSLLRGVRGDVSCLSPARPGPSRTSCTSPARGVRRRVCGGAHAHRRGPSRGLCGACLTSFLRQLEYRRWPAGAWPAGSPPFRGLHLSAACVLQKDPSPDPPNIARPRS